MERVADGIHQVGRGYVHAFVVDGDEGVALVDTGLPRRHAEITDGLRSIGRGPEDVSLILLTHAHADHVGGAARLKEATGADVVASAIDAPAVRGEEPAPPPPILGGALSFLTRLVPSAEPVAVDHEVSASMDHGLPDDMAVVATPGHTPGHVCYLLDRGNGFMFVGDAAVSKDGAVGKGFMNRATPDWRASIARIAQHDFDTALFGHAEPIRQGASAAFARFAAAP